MPSLVPYSMPAEVELTDEQQRQVRERAEAEFHRDWFPWPPLLVHGLSIAVFLLAYMLSAYWLDRPSILAVLPALVMSLPISHLRPFRRPSIGSTWRFYVYAGVAMLMLVVVAILVGWRALLINVGAMGMVVLVLTAWSQRAMQPYVETALRDLGYEDVCGACGYRLLGLPHTIVQCPECGEVRTFPPGWLKQQRAAERTVNQNRSDG